MMMSFTCLLAAGIAAAPLPQVEEFKTAAGLDVVLVRIPDAPTTALHVFVRTGASQDPWMKNGLAHLLEHLVFHGTYAQKGVELQEAVDAEGAYVNAFTSPEDTTYVLRAPSGAWLGLAGNYLDTITNPALSLSPLNIEQGVIDVESIFFSQASLFWLAEMVLFPGNRGSVPVIGTRGTRRNVTFQDITDFYAQHYVPRNTTFMVVGDAQREQVEMLLEQHVHWPPHFEDEAAVMAAMDLNVPVSQSVPGRITGVIFGYHTPDMDGPACEGLAALLQLRLTEVVVGAKALASDVSAHCTSMRGRALLLASAASASYEGHMLPDLLEAAFAGAAARPATARERGLIRRRGRSRLRRVIADPDALAGHLSPALRLRPGTARTQMLGYLVKNTLPGSGTLQSAARRAFVPSKRFLVHVTPF